MIFFGSSPCLFLALFSSVLSFFIYYSFFPFLPHLPDRSFFGSGGVLTFQCCHQEFKAVLKSRGGTHFQKSAELQSCQSSFLILPARLPDLFSIALHACLPNLFTKRSLVPVRISTGGKDSLCRKGERPLS